MQAEKDRDAAQADRGAGADERVQAGRDRNRARADRTASAHDRRAAAMDALTGAYVHAAGLARLRDEVVGARRAGYPISVACVRLGGPEASQVAADAFLIRVANGLTAALANRDVIVRYGPQEFVCAFPRMHADAVTVRLSELVATLAGPPRFGGVNIGVAELTAGDTVEQLIERADQARRRALDRAV